MRVSGGGKFSHVIKTDELSKGLRRSKRNPRNNGALIDCQGAVGQDGILQVIDALTRMDATVVDDFPFPQLFVFTSLIIVCSRTIIYEWVGSVLVEKLTVASGLTWSAIDFFEYIYMSNQSVAVIRNAGNGTYSETSELPAARSICNFNGQVLIGSPNV